MELKPNVLSFLMWDSCDPFKIGPDSLNHQKSWPRVAVYSSLLFESVHFRSIFHCAKASLRRNVPHRRLFQAHVLVEERGISNAEVENPLAFRYSNLRLMGFLKCRIPFRIDVQLGFCNSGHQNHNRRASVSEYIRPILWFCPDYRNPEQERVGVISRLCLPSFLGCGALRFGTSRRHSESVPGARTACRLLDEVSVLSTSQSDWYPTNERWNAWLANRTLDQIGI